MAGLAATIPASADVITLFAANDAELTGNGGAQNNAAAAANWGGLTYLAGNINETGGPVSTNPAPAGQIYFNNNSGDSRGLLRFDLSVLPENIIIDSATVQLYVGRNGFIEPKTNRITSVSLYEVTSPWAEMDVTFDNRPSWDTTAVSSLSIPGGTGKDGSIPFNGYITGNLTNLTREWYGGTATNYGLITSDTANSKGLLRIYAHEADGESLDPRLNITYHVAPVPEPASVILFLSLVGVAAVANRRRAHNRS